MVNCDKTKIKNLMSHVAKWKLLPNVEVILMEK